MTFSHGYAWDYITTVCVSWDCYNKYHRVGGLDYKCFFLTVLEVGMVKLKGTADSESPGDLPSNLQMAAFLL